MNRVLNHTPDGVCYNCLNLAHGICMHTQDGTPCRCHDRNHDDSEWWVSATQEISKVEMIWNEAKQFAPDLISAWIGVGWSELPDKVKEQFTSLVSEDIPRLEKP